MSRPRVLLALLALSTLAACGAQVVEFPLGSDVVINKAPSVVSTLPDADAVNVAQDSVVSVTFDEAMAPATLDDQSFSVLDGTARVAGTISVNATGFTATFTPAVPLAPSHVYIGTVTTGAQDVAGAPLAADYTWSFTTAPESLIPTVIAVLPADLAVDVAVSALVTATFSEPMAAATLDATSFMVTESVGGAAVAGSVSYAGSTATFTPTVPLQPATLYEATVTTGAETPSGIALAANVVWTWTTAGADLSAPTVIATIPVDLALDVPLTTLVSAKFSEPMAPSSLVTTTFVIMETVSSDIVGGSVAYDTQNETATFTPTTALRAATAYTGRITIGALDLSGTPLAADYVWTFTTADATPPTVLATTPIDLATAVPLTTTVSATFSTVMDATTLVSPAVTFVVVQTTGAIPVAGLVTYAGNIATFTPTAPLLADTDYTATITTAAMDLDSLGLAAPYTWTWTTAAVADLGAPTVVSTIPLDLALDVSPLSVVTATFSEAMAPQTIITSSMTVAESLSGNTVAGTVSYDVQTWTATFTPNVPLTMNLEYVATVTIEATDLAGNPLAAEASWTFTIAALVPPTVISTQPQDLSIDVPPSTLVSATFSVPMDPATFALLPATFTVEESLTGTPVLGVVAYLGNVATFAPTAPLLVSTEYLATITTAATDLDGTPLASDVTWIWTTSAFLDVGPPTIVETEPKDLAIDVPVNGSISAIFSEPIDAATLDLLSFTVVETLSGATVAGTVSYDMQNLVATFTPTAPLLVATNYTVTVTDVVTDLTGDSLVVPSVLGLPVPNPWTFDTAALVIPPLPLAINLRGIETFGIASRAGLTSTGVTVVNGDVALYPLGGCIDSTGNAGASQSCLFITYASPTGLTVNGSIYWAGDPFDNGGTANSVTNDLNIAWVEGKNLADTMPSVAANELGGKIFLPGVYHNSTLGLAAGTFATMDAQNDPNATFVFKIDSSFVDSGTLLLPTRIDLVNGAQARNVWFVAGLDVTVGSGTTWNGTILAGRTATVLDGSSVTGRVLAGASGAGAITLTGAASPSLTSITVPK